MKKVEEMDAETRLQCLSCSTDFRLEKIKIRFFAYDLFSTDFSSKRLDTMDSCYNPASTNTTKLRQGLLTVCPPETRFCKLEVFRIGGVLSGVARSCGGGSCVESCFQRGYGAEFETCTQCCGGIHTNETDTTDTSSDKFNCS